MHTQIACPNCGTPFTAEIHQVIDVGRQPELKRMLLSGQLNVAVCPSCQTPTQLSSALLYHDPAHELFMVYVPQELQLDQMKREQYIGQLTRQVIEGTPPEQRRGYMFSETTVLTMDSFMEKVLETEGITREMIDRQRKQGELLNTLATADTDVVEYLIKERSSEIDETFFAMLRSYIEAASQQNNNAQLIPLINLQAKLMTETEVGRRIEQQNMALSALNMEAKAEGGLSPRLLLRHILQNQEDPPTVRIIAQAGAQALTYEFFTGLTAEIEKQKLAGKEDKVISLTQIRTELLEFQEELRNQSERILREAQDTLALFLQSGDVSQVVRANQDRIDDAFMYVLTNEIDRAEQAKQIDRLEKLNQISEEITKSIQGDAPPEIQFLTLLVQAENEDDIERLIIENQELISPELLQVIDMLQDQAQTTGQEQLIERLGIIKGKIGIRLASN